MRRQLSRALSVRKGGRLPLQYSPICSLLWGMSVAVMIAILLRIAADYGVAAWREHHACSQLASTISGSYGRPDIQLWRALSGGTKCFRRSDTFDGIRPGGHWRSKHSRLHRWPHLGLE